MQADMIIILALSCHESSISPFLLIASTSNTSDDNKSKCHQSLSIRRYLLTLLPHIHSSYITSTHFIMLDWDTIQQQNKYSWQYENYCNFDNRWLQLSSLSLLLAFDRESTHTHTNRIQLLSTSSSIVVLSVTTNGIEVKGK